MAFYKDKRDKWDVRYLGIWFFVGNASNFILEFFEKEPSFIKNSIVFTSIFVVITILLVPLLLNLCSGSFEKWMLNKANTFKGIYNIVGITMFTVCIVYIVVSSIKFYFGL